MVKVAISGVAGRMGKAILENGLLDKNITFTGGLVRPQSESLNKDLGELIQQSSIGIRTTDKAEAAFKDADVIIDFTLPEVLLKNLDFYVAHQKKLVVGGTGFTKEQKAQLEKAASIIPVVYAPNMSLGINVCLGLIRQASKILKEYDAEVFEAHHSLKKDAPSGTALALGRAIAEGRGQVLEEVADLNRHDVKKEREHGTIGFATVRGGNIIGDHSAMFIGPYERVEITHKAQSREAFAQGALVAARWLKDKDKGLYDMQDVLGLK